MLRSLNERLLIGDFLEGRDLLWSNLDKLKSNHGHILLQREQIRVQRETADRFERATLFGAGLVASEIRSMTERMEETLEAGFDSVADAVDSAGERISKSVDAAARMISDSIQDSVARATEMVCGHLFEIQWQLARSEARLDDILQTLRESRANEARQLLNEARSLFRNEELDEAKDSLLKALEKSKVDYGVLFLLGLIAWEQEDAEAAARYFGLAATRPEKLPSDRKAQAQAMQARALYSLGNYIEAYAFMAEAVALMKDNAQYFYHCALYAAHSKKPDKAFESLDAAIKINRSFFVKAASDPELNRHLSGIDGYLVFLTQKAQESLQSQVLTLKEDAKNATLLCRAASVTETFKRLDDCFTNGSRRVQSLSYSQAISGLRKLDSVSKNLSATKEHLKWWDTYASAGGRREECRVELKAAQESLNIHPGKQRPEFPALTQAWSYQTFVWLTWPIAPVVIQVFLPQFLKREAIYSDGSTAALIAGAILGPIDVFNHFAKAFGPLSVLLFPAPFFAIGLILWLAARLLCWQSNRDRMMTYEKAKAIYDDRESVVAQVRKLNSDIRSLDVTLDGNARRESDAITGIEIMIRTMNDIFPPERQKARGKQAK